MVYAYYQKMPDALVYQAMKKLPEWMVEVSERFDEVVNSKLIDCRGIETKLSQAL